MSELLPGETFAVLDVTGDWAWGYGCHDHYVGYLPADGLASDVAPPTHVVTATAALVFAAPDIKSPLLRRAGMGARMAGTVSDHFLALHDGGYVHLSHLSPMQEHATDPAAVALRLLGTPYLWGGRSGLGIDCSGLVQLAFALCGVAVPRDSDQQAAIGRGVGDDEPALRGDVVVFPGHVGLMIDDVRLVHANAHWMQVTVEPLADVLARGAGGAPLPVLARRRLES